MRAKAEKKEVQQWRKRQYLMKNVSVEKPANSINHSTSSANNLSACQEISHTFWNPKVHHRVHSSPSLSLIWSQIKTVRPNLFALTHQRPNLFWPRATPAVVFRMWQNTSKRCI